MKAGLAVVVAAAVAGGAYYVYKATRKAAQEKPAAPVSLPLILWPALQQPVLGQPQPCYRHPASCHSCTVHIHCPVS